MRPKNYARVIPCTPTRKFDLRLRKPLPPPLSSHVWSHATKRLQSWSEEWDVQKVKHIKNTLKFHIQQLRHVPEPDHTDFNSLAKPINSRRPMLDYICNLMHGCAKSNNTIESTGRLSRINHAFPSSSAPIKPCGSPENAGCKRLIYLTNSLIGTDWGSHMDIKHKQVTRGWPLDAPAWLHGLRSGIMFMWLCWSPIHINIVWDWRAGFRGQKLSSWRVLKQWWMAAFLKKSEIKSGLYWFWQGFWCIFGCLDIH
jgi:hypothetical protein